MALEPAVAKAIRARFAPLSGSLFRRLASPERHSDEQRRVLTELIGDWALLAEWLGVTVPEFRVAMCGWAACTRDLLAGEDQPIKTCSACLFVVRGRLTMRRADSPELLRSSVCSSVRGAMQRLLTLAQRLDPRHASPAVSVAATHVPTPFDRGVRPVGSLVRHGRAGQLCPRSPSAPAILDSARRSSTAWQTCRVRCASGGT